MEKKDQGVSKTGLMLQANGVVIDNDKPDVDPEFIKHNVRISALEKYKVFAYFQDGEPIDDIFELMALAVNAYLSSRNELTL